MPEGLAQTAGEIGQFAQDPTGMRLAVQTGMVLS